MVDHRRTPNRGTFVPAGWMIVGAVLVLVGAGGWLGTTLLSDDTAQAETPTPTRTTPSPTATEASPTPERTTDEPTDEPEPTEEPEVERTAPVSVLNNTGIANLATQYTARVRQAGWTIAGIGNWRGQIVSNTVYFPDGLENEGRLLAEDLDIDRVMPSIVPMRDDRLTIILSGPQQ